MKTLSDEVVILRYRMERGEDPNQIALDLPKVVAEQYLGQKCECCGAAPGKPCVTPTNRPRAEVHTVRRHQ